MVALAATALFGCVPQPRSTAVLRSPDTTSVDLCTIAQRVITERGSLGDAYELVVQDQVPAAAELARQIRQRLLGATQDLRKMRVLPAREDLRLSIRSHAEVLSEAAAVVAERGGSAFDRDVILAYGRRFFPIIDGILRLAKPDDPIADACPAIAFAPEPVTLPPDPTNEDLGLPNVVGDLLLEVHVSGADPQMAEALEAAGVDPNTVREIEVFASDIDGGGTSLSIIDGIPGPSEVLARAIQSKFLQGAVATGSEGWGGFDVLSFRRSGELAGTVHIATRRERVVVLFDARDAFVRQFLEALR